MSTPILAVAIVLAFAVAERSEALSSSTARGVPGGLIGARASAAHRAASVCVVRPRNEARYRGVGYDHFVHLDSACTFRVSCSVTTDVNPTTVRVGLPAEGHAEVLTYRGSPSRAFHATVRCQRGKPSDA